MTTNSSTLRRRLGVAVAGAGAAAVLMTGAGAATAAPMHPKPGPAHVAPSQKVPGTSCTVVQVERALAKEDPALWAKINANPMRKKHFEHWLVMTPQQRKDKRAEFRKKHPNAAQWMKNHHKKFTPAERAKMKALKAKVKATCGQF